MNYFVQEDFTSSRINFKIEDEIAVNPIEFQAFNSDFFGNRVVCEIDKVNGARALAYTIPHSISLNQFLRKKLYKPEFIKIFSNVISQLIYFEDKRMPIRKVILNSKYIYLTLEKLDVQLLYMPVEKNFSECNVYEFIGEFIESVSCADESCKECVKKIKEFVNSNCNYELGDLNYYVLNMKPQSVVGEKCSSSVEAAMPKEAQEKGTNPYLVRSKTNELISIYKSGFSIGKGSDSDYQIVDNKKVSRRHCTIIRTGKDCYVVDNNSTNQTYVNGRAIQPGEGVLLYNDDSIRIADENFKYWTR